MQMFQVHSSIVGNNAVVHVFSSFFWSVVFLAGFMGVHTGEKMTEKADCENYLQCAATVILQNIYSLASQGNIFLDAASICISLPNIYSLCNQQLELTVFVLTKGPPLLCCSCYFRWI
jgi:hypothetical protein